MDQYSPILKRKLEVYFDRSRQTIVEFLNAYVKAESREFPRRKELIEVYEYVMLDNHLKAVIDNRKVQVLGERWHLVDQAGEILEEETKLLRRKWFRDFVSHALDARFFGYSLLELGPLDPKSREITEVVLVERRNTDPYGRQVLVRPHDLYGYKIDDPQFATNYVLVDGGEGLGLLLKAAPNVIYKRYALAAWVEHAEKFSIPMMEGKTDLNDATAVATLKSNLAAAGREMLMITGHGDEFKVHPINNADAHKIYDQLAERINTEISKLIVGQTMTTDQGSSRSQAEVHQDTSDGKAKEDREMIESLVNDQLLPRLVAMGYPLKGARFEFNMSRESSIEDKVKIFELLLGHYKVDPTVIKDAFGVDVEEKEEPETLPAQPGKPGKF